jgi:uncharacterized membrane protein YfcA
LGPPWSTVAAFGPALGLLPAVGLGVGLLAGLFGVGGGILAVPALGLLLHFDPHAAEGTSLAMIVPTTALAAYRYARRGSVRWPAAALLGGTALASSFAAAHLALALPGPLLRSLFGVFLLFTAWRTARHDGPTVAGPRGGPRGPATGGRQAYVQAGIGVLTGALSGLLGVGGGTIATPGLVLLCGFPEQVAQGTSLAALTLSSSAGASGYALAGDVHWWAAAALFSGAALTVPLGAALAHRLPERTLRRAFAVLAAAVGLLELGGR